ncbi:hypothetical protein D9M72_214950 [compost metagenome]
MNPTAVSNSDASTLQPLPVRSLRTTAARIPVAACMPVAWSMGEIGLRTAGPSSSPVMDIMPQNACRMTS